MFYRARVVACLIGVAVGSIATAQELEQDPRIHTGTLENGLKWMWRSHDNPPNKFAMWVHVDSGSLNETEQQRGLAHFIEHMGFNGTEHYGPGELIAYFESIGMEFGPDVNAHTGFDETAYKLYLPDTELDTVDTGLKVLSDYAFRMLLLPEEIEKERGVIMSELRSGMGVQQRLRDQFFEKVFAGTRLAQRLPIGIEEVILGATQRDFIDYYRTWYRPEHMTLMIVADAEPDAYIPLIKRWFGEYTPTVPARPLHGPELKPFDEPRAFVLADPEYAQGDVALYNVRPGRPPITTVDRVREEMVDEVGRWIVNRRLTERVKKGEASFRYAYASTFDLMNDALLATASATGEPAEWEKMLEEVIVEVNRAAEHGFTKRELELARKDLIASAERAVETESTRNARAIISQMNATVGAEEPVLSAAQQLELYERLLPDITKAEAEKAFAGHFDTDTFAYVLRMPEKDDLTLPTPAAVLAAARAAQARKTEPPTEEQRETSLLAQAPVPGQLVARSWDDDLKIMNGWLSNGARLHHRFMDYKKDSVLVAITLAGGTIEETAANAGVTEVAALILDQPATSRLSSTDIEDIMTGKKISVSGSAGGDTFVVEISGSPEDLETALQLAHALLTDGTLEQSAFDNWKKASLQRYEMATKEAMFAVQRQLAKMLSGDDPRRMALMPPEIIEQQSIERSQKWFERLCREAPIEVAVVGDMELDALLPLVEKYVGSLPKRSRSADHLDDLRKFDRGPGPYSATESVETMTPVAVAVAGFLSCNARDVEDLRPLNLTRYILDSRLIKRIREELGIVYSIGAYHVPSETYRDSGMFISGAPCAPGKSPDVAKEVLTIFTAFAESGPTPEELQNAKKQVANSLDTQLKEPSFWFSQLRTLDLHDRSLDDLKNIEEAYQSLTAEQLQQTFAKYYTPQRTVQVTAEPKMPAAEPAEEQAEPTTTPG